MPNIFGGQKVLGQGHNALITENGLCRIISIPLHLHLQTPHEVRMWPIDFGVKRSKVKVTMHGLIKMVIGA